MTTMPHSRQVLLRCAGVFLKAEGVELMEVHDDDGENRADLDDHEEQGEELVGHLQLHELVNQRSTWPVDEMGSHSVMPSTIPLEQGFPGFL